MPWSPAQHRLFAWTEHNPGAAKAADYNIPQETAARLSEEGVKASYGAKIVDAAMRGRRKKYG